MTRRTAAALAEQTAMADLLQSRLDAAHQRIAELEEELATTDAVARYQLVRNAELAAREPIVVIDMAAPDDDQEGLVRDAMHGLDRALREMEAGR